MFSTPGIPRPTDTDPDAAVQRAGSGYYRGAPPIAGGTGSMAGPKGAGTRPLWNAEGWTPTVTNLIILVLLELGAYVVLRYAFRSAHGG